MLTFRNNSSISNLSTLKAWSFINNLLINNGKEKKYFVNDFIFDEGELIKGC